MKNRRWWLVALAMLAAAAGHIAYWYLPRERSAAIDRATPAGELFLAADRDVRVWLAFPHQNVAAAARALDDPAAAVGAAVRLAGLGTIALPAFGPFALPPARALAVAVDRGGENFTVAVEVYPAVALIARVAGRVAANPVLRGGTVTASGRRVRVAWRGFTWSVVEIDDDPGLASPLATPPVEPGLAFLALGRPQGAVEAGTYRLRREHRDLVLASSEQDGWRGVATLAEDLAEREDLAFLGLRAEETGGRSVLIQPRSEARGLSLPDAAVGWVGAVKRWSLPGERILRLLGLDPVEGHAGEWSLVAMDQASLEVATRVAPALGDAAATADVSFALWVRPRDYLPLVAAIAGALDAVPIASRDEVAYWRDLEILLQALGPVERLRATVVPGGGEARLGWGDR